MHSPTPRRALPVLSLFILGLFITGAAAEPKEKVIILSWGDMIGDHTGDKRFDGAVKVDKAENMKTLAAIWKAKGVNKVLFRVDDWRLLQFMQYYTPPADDNYKDYRKIVADAWESGLLGQAVAAIQAAGVEIYMWVSIIDEGCPPTLMYADSVPWPWQSRFFRDHPEYQSSDRTPTTNGRKYLWGVPEFAYPEVRQHLLSEITFFSDKFPFNGVFLSFRSHSIPAEHGDQYGFNAPVVEEYRKRYGTDIMRQPFELDRWRSLRGDYFTQFIREVSEHVRAHGQKISLGVPQGEHAGPPVGNLELQWRRWVSEKLVDELVVGHHTISRSIYRYHWQLPWGYIQDQDGHIGLPPIAQSLEQDYGPLCRKFSVKLYVDVPLGNFHRVFDDPSMGKGIETPEATARFEAEMEQLPSLTGIVVDGRPYNLPIPN